MENLSEKKNNEAQEIYTHMIFYFLLRKNSL